MIPGKMRSDHRRKRPKRSDANSAVRSGLLLAVAGIAIGFGASCKPSVLPRKSASVFGARPVRVASVARSRSVGWLDAPDNRSGGYRSCGARQTETHQFGPIRVIDVGDEVLHLSSFFASEQRDASARHEPCLVVASLADCPSCAAIGFALASGALGHVLGRLTLLRVDVDEFAEELRQLGVSPSRVPAFALLDHEGKVASVLDTSEWRGNDPSEFLPLLSTFVRGPSIHQRGGRHSRWTSGSLDL